MISPAAVSVAQRNPKIEGYIVSGSWQRHRYERYLRLLRHNQHLERGGQPFLGFRDKADAPMGSSSPARQSGIVGFKKSGVVWCIVPTMLPVYVVIMAVPGRKAWTQRYGRLASSHM